jgi:hypothetical protein
MMTIERPSGESPHSMPPAGTGEATREAGLTGAPRRGRSPFQRNG